LCKGGARLPWEETEQHIHNGHRSLDDFRQDSLRTVVLSEEESIKAVVGKPKGKTETEVVSYLFEKEKGWTLDRAKAWFAKHGENQRKNPQLSCLSGLSRRLLTRSSESVASPLPPEQAET
jgi:hypothetical protein